jgi:uncharacterized delta-60 repeat protein
MSSSNNLIATSSTNNILSVFYRDHVTAGQVITDLNSNSTDKAYACVVDSQDRVIVVGKTETLRQYVDIPSQSISSESAGNHSHNFGELPTSDAGSHLHTVNVPAQNNLPVKPEDINNKNFCIVRYLNTGALDMSFGKNGVVITDIKVYGTSNQDDYGKSVAIDSRDRIVVIGTTYNNDISNNDFAVVRYNNMGVRDTRFGCNHNGIVITDIDCSNDDYAYGVAIDSNDRIVVCGHTEDCDDKIALVRYTAWGDLDSSFGEGGKVITYVYSDDAYARAIAIDASDNIVVGGWEDDDDNLLLVRYTESGDLDITFDVSGIFTTDMHCDNNDKGYAIVVDASRNIYLAGVREGSPNQIALIKVTSEGVLDETFGDDGKVLTNVNSNHSCARAIALDASGRVVLAGTVENCTSDFLLVRYDLSGNLDNTFGDNGIVETDILGNKKDDYARGMAIDSTGTIIVAGYTYVNDLNSNDFVLVRYTEEGAVDDINLIYKEITFDGGETWLNINDIGHKFTFPNYKQMLLINFLDNNISGLNLGSNDVLNVALRTDECTETNYILTNISQTSQSETNNNINNLFINQVIPVFPGNSNLL